MNAAKRATAVLAAAAITLSLSACGTGAATSAASPSPAEEVSAAYEGERSLVLSDDQVTLDGLAIAEEDAGDVTVSHDIVYYESGQGSDYGEGAEADEHDAEETQAHTVVTIRSAGTYRLSGSLSQGQIAIDLGDDAEDDPDAVVTLILDGVDVTCTVAPALIFYNVYECGSSDVETAASEVDTYAAGANVIIADGSANNFDGSHVARIYEPGTTDKLHKYDGAFYSKMSMNVSGETAGDGVLNITGDNEGLDTELHMTINGGVINIDAANDGINTNEDNVSVTTINGGMLNIDAGLGSEGDGIDSNGWLVINGGSVFASACAAGGDSGIDASLEIVLNGGTVVALGNMFDAISSDSEQNYLTLTLAEPVRSGDEVELTGADGSALFDFTAPKTASMILLSGADIEDGAEYTLTVNGTEREYSAEGMMGAPGGMGGPGGMGEAQPDMGQPPRRHGSRAHGHPRGAGGLAERRHGRARRDTHLAGEPHTAHRRTNRSEGAKAPSLFCRAVRMSDRYCKPGRIGLNLSITPSEVAHAEDNHRPRRSR